MRPKEVAPGRHYSFLESVATAGDSGKQNVLGVRPAKKVDKLRQFGRHGRPKRESFSCTLMVEFWLKCPKVILIPFSLIGRRIRTGSRRCRASAPCKKDRSADCRDSYNGCRSNDDDSGPLPGMDSGRRKRTGEMARKSAWQRLRKMRLLPVSLRRSTKGLSRRRLHGRPGSPERRCHPQQSPSFNASEGRGEEG